MRAYLAACIKHSLSHALKMRGYKDIIFKDMEDILEVEADGLRAYVYHLDLFNPKFDDINYPITSVLRQLEAEKIKMG